MASNYDEYIKELDSGRTAEVQEAEKLYELYKSVVAEGK